VCKIVMDAAGVQWSLSVAIADFNSVAIVAVDSVLLRRDKIDTFLLVAVADIPPSELEFVFAFNSNFVRATSALGKGLDSLCDGIDTLISTAVSALQYSFACESVFESMTAQGTDISISVVHRLASTHSCTFSFTLVSTLSFAGFISVTKARTCILSFEFMSTRIVSFMFEISLSFFYFDICDTFADTLLFLIDVQACSTFFI